MMSEGIVFLLILASATSGPWLATIIMAKAKRCHGRRVIEREFAKHFPPIGRRRPKATPGTQIVTRTVRVAGERSFQ